jgi:epoxyqueuosine reductase
MPHTDLDLPALAANIKGWGRDQGFDAIGIARASLADAEPRLAEWLAKGFHGEMHYMTLHGARRARPAELIPGTVTVIVGRMAYFPATDPPPSERRGPRARSERGGMPSPADPRSLLDDGHTAYIARYALGRDYHKVLRRRLQRLADRIEQAIGPFGYRVFTDTGPVMEKPLAQAAGVGWIGKHTNLIDKDAGSWFFLGELLTDLPLPPDAPHATDHCGSCTSCMEVCPTQAIVAPYQLDARRCISYLTIEHPGSIDPELRPLMGNRIYGCDDCQLFCPWNKFAVPTREPDFAPRHGLDAAQLIELFAWDEAEFLATTEGTAIWRIGHARWLRNIAIALGNSLAKSTDRDALLSALRARSDHPDPMVREHVAWALAQRS